MTRKAKPIRKLDLALQGGGSHGAFTWGVLDRLLEEEDIEIAGISGTSAGAMNAAVLADGYRAGGREGARTQLRDFWTAVSTEAKRISPFSGLPMPEEPAYPPGFGWLASLNPMEMVSHVFSPYDFNPMNYNPLRKVLERLLHCQNLQGGIPLFITATNVETGEARVFREGEITIDVLLASACLPMVYQAVEIDGVPYWDGGYMGNPSIWPLIYGTECADILLVQINPLLRHGTPKTAMDIMNRVNEISFNSSLIAEMRAIHFVGKLVREGKLDDANYKDMRMHRVMPPQDGGALQAASKMNASMEFFEFLFEMGRAQMQQWLETHKADIGTRGTIDIQQHFLEKHY